MEPEAALQEPDEVKMEYVVLSPGVSRSVTLSGPHA
jgi:hypothetical protein